MKAFKAFIKFFQDPQRREKIKIQVNLYHNFLYQQLQGENAMKETVQAMF